MKKIYNFIYCVDNTDYSDSCLIDFSNFMEENSYILKILDDLEISPEERVVNNIMEFAKNQL